LLRNSSISAFDCPVGGFDGFMTLPVALNSKPVQLVGDIELSGFYLLGLTLYLQLQRTAYIELSNRIK
jgi:hypothetical protein